MWKRAFDLVFASALLLTSAPLLAAAAVAVYIDTGRPIFFVQKRAGRHGRPFPIFKLRTLRTNTDDDPSPTTDATAVGKVLRRWAIDELPQLWNVLRGDMSIIGPRPVLLPEARGYDDRRRRRLAVRPGLTGWAQIHGRNALHWHERVELDLWYVDHATLWTDLKILLYTPVILLSATGVRGPGTQDPTTTDVQQRSAPESISAESVSET
ncbi:MAG: sugar transferase [Salinibacter sp.]